MSGHHKRILLRKYRCRKLRITLIKGDNHVHTTERK